MLGLELVCGRSGPCKGFCCRVVKAAPVGQAKDCGDFVVPQNEIFCGFVCEDGEACGGGNSFGADLALIEEGGFGDGSLSRHGGREGCDEGIVLQE